MKRSDAIRELARRKLRLRAWRCMLALEKADVRHDAEIENVTEVEGLRRARAESEARFMAILDDAGAVGRMAFRLYGSLGLGHLPDASIEYLAGLDDASLGNLSAYPAEAWEWLQFSQVNTQHRFDRLKTMVETPATGRPFEPWLAPKPKGGAIDGMTEGELDRAIEAAEVTEMQARMDERAAKIAEAMAAEKA